MTDPAAGGFHPRNDPIPARAGVGLKPEHYRAILDEEPDFGWFEIHAENYMGAGGPPHRYLAALRERYPMSLHGVGLSIGAARPLDTDHLARLKALNDRYQPGQFSEHLAWSSHDTVYFNDLLPVPFTEETLARVAEHIDQVQSTMGRQMLLENPSSYVIFSESTISEIEFLSEVVRRTGCGLLLDVNNVLVSAVNLDWSAEAYIDAFPVEHVGEIHLAGHAPETDDKGRPLLIDAHDRPVDERTWTLYRRTMARAGPKPTLIEWDNDVPSWPVLFQESQRAEAEMQAALAERPVHAVAG